AGLRDLKRSRLALVHVGFASSRSAHPGFTRQSDPRVRGVARSSITTVRSPHYMTSSIEATQAPSSTSHIAVDDVGSDEDFLAAIDDTIKYFNDGDIVEGVIV